MQYIQLTDSSYILSTSEGTKTITNRSFNYNKIKHLIDLGATEEEILPLTVPPVLEDGLYEAYLIPKLDAMYVSHKTQGNVDYIWVSKEFEDRRYALDDIPSEAKQYLGMYTSMNDVYADWPEYTL